MQAEALAIVDGDPVGIQLGDAVRAARIERRRLVLQRGLHLTEHLARRRLVEPGRRDRRRRMASSRFTVPIAFTSAV